jgi:hypothetical protein
MPSCLLPRSIDVRDSAFDVVIDAAFESALDAAFDEARAALDVVLDAA